MPHRADAIHLGVTGHRHLIRDTVELVTHALDECVARHAAARPLMGISCLAEGADQLFARIVLEHGGDLEVVIPAEDYSAKMTEPVDDTLYFAGEHTDTSGHWGTVHGALRSGLRAATQLQNAAN